MGCCSFKIIPQHPEQYSLQTAINKCVERKMNSQGNLSDSDALELEWDRGFPLGKSWARILDL